MGPDRVDVIRRGFVAVVSVVNGQQQPRRRAGAEPTGSHTQARRGISSVKTKEEKSAQLPRRN
jgi:hypothetical protein